MQKAIVIVASGVELDPGASADLLKVAGTILAHTVTVRTPECVGEGVAIAGTIITSLFLVRNHRMVSISSSGGETQAVVSDRDERNFLAKLEPVSLDVSSRKPIAGGERPRFNIGPIASHGDPLFMTDASGGAPVVTVAAMTYRINLFFKSAEAQPNAWRFDPKLPQGIIGGGVWNTNGKFVGLSLGRKIPFNVRALGDENRLFALPAEEVMEFAETK